MLNYATACYYPGNQEIQLSYSAAETHGMFMYIQDYMLQILVRWREEGGLFEDY